MLGIVSGVPFFVANKLLIAFALPVITSAAICIIGSMITKQSNVSKNSLALAKDR
ncbi:hypothetical protein [Alkaliphilus sp. B6464]|uniref:hypothetical protein n=1 Tax=Alkaliphilus sp. B6464 TaxID=2731219 RepID=UPI001BAE0931|nr:hypothetical protein [Alkaliphilus sp. B6464]QUH19223.1 hypothetical protein HYG84_04490 [Alkaliphilus sp. B6464]